LSLTPTVIWVALIAAVYGVWTFMYMIGDEAYEEDKIRRPSKWFLSLAVLVPAMAWSFTHGQLVLGGLALAALVGLVILVVIASL
jgi:hypothetical protein